MMNLLRQILAVLALAVAGSGSLPLVVHHFHCHHSDALQGIGHFADAHASESGSSDEHDEAAAQSVSQLASCSCAHVYVPEAKPLVGSETASQATASAAREDCSVCFQLSQVTSVAEHVATVTSMQLAEVVVLHELNFDLAPVDCNNPPRGPPAV